jgi:hypothetical protein
MKIIGLLIAGVLGTGCYAETGVYTPAYVGPSVSVTATTVGPDLVYVSPGVQVIADYGEPVFYADGYYWRESGGIWYRSSYHTHGWVSYRAPYSIVSIRDRHTYRHYRPAGYVPRANRSYRGDNRPHSYRSDNRPQARQHETKRAAPRNENRPAKYDKKKK